MSIAPCIRFRVLSLGLILTFLSAAAFSVGQGEASTKDRTVTPRGALTTEEARLVELFEKAAPTVVNVRSKQTVGSLFNSAGFERTAGTGTGFIWDFDGHVVTNYHVVARATAGVTVVAGTRPRSSATAARRSRRT